MEGLVIPWKPEMLCFWLRWSLVSDTLCNRYDIAVMICGMISAIGSWRSWFIVWIWIWSKEKKKQSYVWRVYYITCFGFCLLPVIWSVVYIQGTKRLRLILYSITNIVYTFYGLLKYIDILLSFFWFMKFKSLY